MAYTTLSGRFSTDPYFDPRSLRSDYYDRHEVEVDVQSQPIKDVDFTADYRAFVRYSDCESPNFTVLRIELLLARSTEDHRRGREQKSRLASGMELCLVPFLAWDAEHGDGRQQIIDRIERHQAERDEELADRLGG